MPKVVDWYHFSYHHNCLRSFSFFLSFRDDRFYHISRTIYNTIYLFKINLPLLSYPHSFFFTCFTHQEIGPQISKFLFFWNWFHDPWNSHRGAKWSEGIDRHFIAPSPVTWRGCSSEADRMNNWSRFNDQDFGSDLVRYSNWLCFDLLIYW